MDYREEIRKLLDGIKKENVLRYLWIIICDIAMEQGIITEVPYEIEDA